QRRQLLCDGLSERARSRAPLAGELLRQSARRGGELPDLRLAPRQLLVVVLQGRKLRPHLIASLQGARERAAVLARDAPQHLDALVDLLQALRVSPGARRVPVQLPRRFV